MKYFKDSFASFNLTKIENKYIIFKVDQSTPIELNLFVRLPIFESFNLTSYSNFFILSSRISTVSLS